MIYFSDKLNLKISSLLKKHPALLKSVREKRFRVADTQLSYRQINSLESSGVLNKENDRSNGWRLFSIKDIVYLKMIVSCREYGIKNEMLKILKDHFYHETKDRVFLGEYAILAVILNNSISWILWPDGKSFFSDNKDLNLLDSSESRKGTSYLYVIFNNLIRESFKGTELEELFFHEDKKVDEVIHSYLDENIQGTK